MAPTVWFVVLTEFPKGHKSVQPVYRLALNGSISMESFYGVCPAFAFTE
jgi:hypothetical protein